MLVPRVEERRGDWPVLRLPGDEEDALLLAVVGVDSRVAQEECLPDGGDGSVRRALGGRVGGHEAEPAGPGAAAGAPLGAYGGSHGRTLCELPAGRTTTGLAVRPHYTLQ